MKILYIAVHSHIGWGAEYWVAHAFEEMGHEVIRYDYRKRRKQAFPWLLINSELKKIAKENRPDVVFIQRGENMPASLPALFKMPVVYWSTEPIQLKNDADKMLSYNDFAQVFVHSYSCLERVKKEFRHLEPLCRVMHNACPREIIDNPQKRERFALFNRTMSDRRREWISPSQDLVECVSGHYGKQYFEDLAQSKIAINVHFSDKNTDDFESGIFEAMAKGCVVVSEKLNPRTVSDLGMRDAYIEVDSPMRMREELLRLRESPAEIELYNRRSIDAVLSNTWEVRAAEFIKTFEKVCSTVRGGSL